MTDLIEITGRRVGAVAAVALLTVLLQVGAYQAVGARSVDDHLRWDGSWYASIVRNGYQSDLPPKAGSLTSNVAFFPGYPVLARLAHLSLGLSVAPALLGTSLLFSFLTWLYVLLLMEKLGLNLRLKCVSYALLLAHPCSFFLVVTYSESTFLALLLGHLFWGLSRSRWRWGLCVLHGIGMTATRIAGLAFVPLLGFRRLLEKPTDRISIPARLGRALVSREALVGYASCLGCLGFFVYTWRTFGHFDLYFQTGRTGWGITPNYLAFFTGGVFARADLLFGRPSGAHAVALSLVALAVLSVLEWRLYRRRGLTRLFRSVRGPVYLCCLIMLYLIVSARHEVRYVSCMRYSLGWIFPLVLAAAALARELGPLLRARTRSIVVVTALLVCLPSLYFQFLLMRRFFLEEWAS